jgi:hypothetical protein
MSPRTVFVLAAALVALSSGPALAQECLHGEDENALERDRRRLALNAVRFINTAQSSHASEFA